jgi:hypothetical protein
MWSPDELHELGRLTRLFTSRCGARGWDVGQTERGDPQLYVLGPEPEQPCLASVSRLGPLYVLEDGGGRVCGEYESLRDLVRHADRSIAKPLRLPLTTRIVLALCAIRTTLEEKLTFVEESAELLARVSPQLSTLV